MSRRNHRGGRGGPKTNRPKNNQQSSSDDEDYSVITNEFGDLIPTVSTAGWEDYRSTTSGHKTKGNPHEGESRQGRNRNQSASRQKDQKNTNSDTNSQDETNPEVEAQLLKDAKYATRGRGQLPVLTSFLATTVSHTGETNTGKKTIRTVFAKESDEEIAHRRELARQPLQRFVHPEKPFPTAFGAPISPKFFEISVPIPQRPAWHKGMTKAALHAQEEAYFKDYLTSVYTTYGTDRLNHFEHNLDVWRQLWRVCERSDLMILTADSRHPLLHFNLGLYNYVTTVLKKPLVLLLNKIDLVPLNTLRRWQTYFVETFPDLKVVAFSSFPTLAQRLALSAFALVASRDAHDAGISGSGDGDAENEDIEKHRQELEQLLQEVSSFSTQGHSSMRSIQEELASHAKLVAKMKKSPVLDPVGVDQLFETCHQILENYRIFDDHPENKGDKSANTNIDDSTAAATATTTTTTDMSEKDKALNLRASRLLTDKDLEKHAARKATVEKQLEKLRAQVENLRQYKAQQAENKAETEKTTGDNEDDVLEINLDDFEVDANEDEHLDEEALEKMLVSSSKVGGSRNHSRSSSKIRGSNKSRKNRGRNAKGKKKRSNIGDDSDDEEVVTAEDLLSLPAGRRGRLRASAGLIRHSKDALSPQDTTEESESEDGETETDADADATENEGTKSTITVGTIGHPNAGKSSLINAITGKKVVSVSRQPGHTKIFQTLKINESTILCDCPGLVFPAVDVPRALQVLSGIYPIPYTREPFSAIQYLAECFPIEKILGLKSSDVPSSEQDGDIEKIMLKNKNNVYPWSAYAICEAYAVKRGFVSAYGRIDVHRSAQTILYAVADGKISFYFEPPNAQNSDENNKESYKKY